MADQQASPPAAQASPASKTPAGPVEEPAPFDWGRVLDVAGIIAGGLLVLIVLDIWTDGRVISRFFVRPQQPQPEVSDEPQQPVPAG